MPVVLVDDLEHRFGFDTGELYVRLCEIEYLKTVELQRRFRFRMAGEEQQEVTDPRDVLTRALAVTDEAFQRKGVPLSA